MANCPIKNTKLLEEAFDAGYYRGLNENEVGKGGVYSDYEGSGMAIGRDNAYGMPEILRGLPPHLWLTPPNPDGSGMTDQEWEDNWKRYKRKKQREYDDATPPGWCDPTREAPGWDLFPEAYEAGYYRALMLSEGIHPPGVPPAPPSIGYSPPRPIKNKKISTSAYEPDDDGGWGGYVPPIDDLPLPLGEGGNLAQWFSWFVNAFHAGWPMQMSMPPGLMDMQQYGWPHDVIVNIQTAFDALNNLLYITGRGGVPMENPDYPGGWGGGVDVLLALLAAMGPNQTPPYNPE